MKPALFLALPALTAASLCSCSTASKNGIAGMPPVAPAVDAPVSLTDLSALGRRPSVKFDKVHVTMRVDSGKSPSVPLADITARCGRPARAVQDKKFPYPGDYDFPKITNAATPSAHSGINPVIPATPRNFTYRNTGIAVEFTATARGPFIMLKGTVTDSQCERLSRNPGQVFSPLKADDGTILTDNKCLSPQFTDRITHFYLAALPGQSLSLPLNSAQPGTFLRITASLPESSKHPVAATRKNRADHDSRIVVASGG